MCQASFTSGSTQQCPQPSYPRSRRCPWFPLSPAVYPPATWRLAVKRPLSWLALAAGLALSAGAVLPAGPVRADLPPLIPRAVLLGNPERAQPQISPDGTKLAYLRADDKDVLQVWVRTIGQNDDKQVTQDKKRGIRQYFWSYN